MSNNIGSLKFTFSYIKERFLVIEVFSPLLYELDIYFLGGNKVYVFNKWIGVIYSISLNQNM